MIDDLEDLVDHLERRHNIEQDVRGIFSPFFDRPRSLATATPCTYPISLPQTTLDFPSFTMAQHPTPFILSTISQQNDPTQDFRLTSANLAYHRLQFNAPTSNHGSHYPTLCASPSPSNFTTATNTTESDTGPWRVSGPPLVQDNKPYSCKCGKVYKRRVGLDSHIGKPVKNHYDTTVYKFSCAYCDEKHPTEEGMQRHMELTHKMKHTKADVRKISSAAASLSNAPETSTKRRKSSAQASSMIEVPASHDAAALKPLPPTIAEYYRTLEPFKCKCGGGFTSHPSLMTHIQYYQKKSFGEAHGDASGGDRYLHPCVICNQFKFTTPKQLKFHLNEHHKVEYVK
ncbi:hypothetical protein FA13DRAFT_1802494 [Coprinellus micaceus]|uniref:C2H2-type domain-containing protein n=1 Tax=Coprinellus micaceus TaxID=71717 RepID=A0A4Y7SC01_COPMI|nr:hypothetical protein FA13DRAFT_1802494 [Coprinellus micaceus]